MIKQITVLFLLSILLGGGRQFLPRGIKWNGQWPSVSTSAEEAYNMMAKEGDPAFISLQEAVELNPHKDVIFLDARSYKEFAEGHLPRARALPFYEVEKYQDAALKDVKADGSIVIYCEGVGCELSFFLGRELQSAGYSNVRIFYGGYPEWQQAGLPIEK